MDTMPSIPDLIQDSKLDTSLHQDYAVHTYVEAKSSRRRIQRKEYWKSVKILGRGSCGSVELEVCTEGKSLGTLHEVKKIRKQASSSAVCFRELEAIAKFPHSKVSRG